MQPTDPNNQTNSSVTDQAIPGSTNIPIKKEFKIHKIKINNYVCIVIFLLLAIFPVICAIITWYYYGKEQAIKLANKNSTSYTYQSPSTNPEPFKNWHTYTNEKYGFKVKYNPDLKVSEHEGTELVGQFSYVHLIKFGDPYLKAQNGFELEVNKKGSLSDYETEIIGHIADEINSVQKINISDISWTLLDYQIFMAADYVSVVTAFTAKYDFGYAITAPKEDINQILFTFEFTD